MARFKPVIRMAEPVKKLLPEQKLWRSVLSYLVIDAFHSKHYKDSTLKDKKESLEILTNMDKSESFVTVCQFAGYNPDYIKRKVRKKFAQQIFSNQGVLNDNC
jgi:hypothetical protein